MQGKKLCRKGECYQHADVDPRAIRMTRCERFKVIWMLICGMRARVTTVYVGSAAQVPSLWGYYYNGVVR